MEDYYGIDHVAHIGTYSVLGVKSGIKDLMRVFQVPFGESNEVSKAIDAIDNEPDTSFKKLDSFKEGTEEEKKKYEDFQKLEAKYPKIFELARKFEGIPRQMGVHASGILVTPSPVTDYLPLRYDKMGTAITLYPGPLLEELSFIKYDILGLKTISVIMKTLNHIDPSWTIEDLYDKVDIKDKKLYEYIASKKTRGIFQLSSNMMQGLIDKIKPTEFNDVVAINSLGRPGPLSASFDTLYANGKHKGEITYPIRGCEDILDETYGVICYQEELMAISRKVAGFDDGQADSITRKITAKKAKDKFPMMIRCHIYGKKNCEGPEGWESDDNAPWYDPKGKYGKEIPGAIVNGYTPEEMKEYFKKIEGFASYAFNRSHSASYSFLSVLCTWLKLNYPTEFMAALLSMADDKIFNEYTEECERLGIEIACPNINISGKDFTPDNNKILYGLSSIKGVGNTSIPDIIENRPYSSIEEAIEKIPKKSFNKRVAEALIKAGAFDFCNQNRLEGLNKLYDAKKIKESAAPRFNEDDWNESTCMVMEEETLGLHITAKSWWENLPVNQPTRVVSEIVSVREHRYNKNGKSGTMAFTTLKSEGITFDAVIFAKQYSNLCGLFYKREGSKIIVCGKKDNKGSFVINEVIPG